jgi:hypothetical protein
MAREDVSEEKTGLIARKSKKKIKSSKSKGGAEMALLLLLHITNQ